MRVTRQAPGQPEVMWTDTESFVLSPVPIDAQPTEYVRVAWADRPYGRVDSARVAARRDGDRVSVRVSWDVEPANGEFPDGAAVFFPLDASADVPSATFGSREAGVRIWAWDARRAAGRRLDGTGPGAFRPAADVGPSEIDADVHQRADGWDLVLSGPVSDAADRMAVAVWSGGNDERAGIGATSPTWTSLEID